MIEKQKDVSKYIVRIPLAIHKKAKVCAIAEGISLEKLILNAISEKVNKK
jgi:predicted HicB family RNase H-like nuclease